MDDDSDRDEELFYGQHDEFDFSEQFQACPDGPDDEYPHDDEENSYCEFNFDNPHESSNDGHNDDEFDVGDLPDDGSHFAPDFGDEDNGDVDEKNSYYEFNFESTQESCNDVHNEFDFGDLADDDSDFEPNFGDEDSGDVESYADNDDPSDFHSIIIINEFSFDNPVLHEDSSSSRSFNPFDFDDLLEENSQYELDFGDEDSCDAGFDLYNRACDVLGVPQELRIYNISKKQLTGTATTPPVDAEPSDQSSSLQLQELFRRYVHQSLEVKKSEFEKAKKEIHPVVKLIVDKVGGYDSRFVMSLEYRGSVYENVKIKEADEFDFDLPIKELRINEGMKGRLHNVPSG